VLIDGVDVALSPKIASVQENAMQHRLFFRMLTTTIALLVVVVSLLWIAPVSFAEPTVTVYKDPT
jgi:hypothetical protein